jgi:hypothetical protein
MFRRHDDDDDGTGAISTSEGIWKTRPRQSPKLAWKPRGISVGWNDGHEEKRLKNARWFREGKSIVLDEREIRYMAPTNQRRREGGCSERGQARLFVAQRRARKDGRAAE